MKYNLVANAEDNSQNKTVKNTNKISLQAFKRLNFKMLTNVRILLKVYSGRMLGKT